MIISKYNYTKSIDISSNINAKSIIISCNSSVLHKKGYKKLVCQTLYPTNQFSSNRSVH